MGLLEYFKKACEINFVKPILDPPDWADTYVGPWLLNDLQDCPICSVPYQVNCGEEIVHVFDILKMVIIIFSFRKDCHRSHQDTHILKNGYQTHFPCPGECV